MVVKNPIGNWMAQLELIRSFRFSSYGGQSDQMFESCQKSDQESFLIATLEAAIEHMKSGQVMGLTEYERDIAMPSDLGEAWLHHVHQGVAESLPFMSDMLDSIKNGDPIRLKNLIQAYENTMKEESLQLINNNNEIEDSLLSEENVSLCHPLCDCESCKRVKKENNSQEIFNKQEETVAKKNLGPLDLKTNEDGLTLLHIACIYGQPKIVDLLTDIGAPLEAVDSMVHTIQTKSFSNIISSIFV